MTWKGLQVLADCPLQSETIDVHLQKTRYNTCVYIYIYQPWLLFPVGIFIDPSYLWLGFSSDLLGRSPSFLRFQWLLNDPFDQDSLHAKLQGMSHFPQLPYGCPKLPNGKRKVPQESPKYSLPMHLPEEAYLNNSSNNKKHLKTLYQIHQPISKSSLTIVIFTNPHFQVQ